MFDKDTVLLSSKTTAAYSVQYSEARKGDLVILLRSLHDGCCYAYDPLFRRISADITSSQCQITRARSVHHSPIFGVPVIIILRTTFVSISQPLYLGGDREFPRSGHLCHFPDFRQQYKNYISIMIIKWIPEALIV